MTFLIFRSSRSEVFCRKRVSLEIAQSSQGNTCSRVSFLIKLQACALLKQRLWHRCFPVNFAKFLRTPFLTEYFRWPLLFCILILKKCISRTYIMPYMYVYNCISRNYGNCGYFVKASWKNRKNFLKILRISE